MQNNNNVKTNWNDDQYFYSKIAKFLFGLWFFVALIAVTVKLFDSLNWISVMVFGALILVIFFGTAIEFLLIWRSLKSTLLTESEEIRFYHITLYLGCLLNFFYFFTFLLGIICLISGFEVEHQD
jgi:hypothetical protein